MKSKREIKPTVGRLFLRSGLTAGTGTGADDDFNPKGLKFRLSVDVYP